MLPFMLYADFESIAKPVNELYREKMNRMKAGRKLSDIIVVVTFFFNDRNKHYPQVFLNDFFKKLTE